jgi:DeoR/GlpR family transcriptional regulator of sugar metabolism
MAAAAKQVIVLAHAAKFGQVAFFDAFDVDDKFEIITDRPLAPAMQRTLEEKGATVTIAGNLKKGGI